MMENKFNSAEGAKSRWNYHTSDTLEQVLNGVDFVVISILPGTFDKWKAMCIPLKNMVFIKQ